jgi:hypothetical protein
MKTLYLSIDDSILDAPLITSPVHTRDWTSIIGELYGFSRGQVNQYLVDVAKVNQQRAMASAMHMASR